MQNEPKNAIWKSENLHVTSKKTGKKYVRVDEQFVIFGRFLNNVSLKRLLSALLIRFIAEKDRSQSAVAKGEIKIIWVKKVIRG